MPADPLRSYRFALARVACLPSKGEEGLLSLLPLLTCAAAGGVPERAVPVAIAWHLLRLASGLLDHVQDGDPFPDDETRPQAVNLTMGLLFAAQLALARLPQYGVSEQRTLALIADFNITALQACAGQYQDLASDRPGSAADAGQAPSTVAEQALEACHQALVLRAGEPFALAARAGATVATDDPHPIALCHEFGYNLGVLWQLADDFDDLWNPRGPSDLALGMRTLPVVYALTMVKVSQRDRLETLLQNAAVGDGEAEAAARQLITAYGAPLYLMAQAQLHRGRAEAALRELGGPRVVQTHLHALLDQAMPVLARRTTDGQENAD